MEEVEAKPVISPELLTMLICPVDHGELELIGSELVCTQCQRRYPINDGVPNMLPPEDR